MAKENRDPSEATRPGPTRSVGRAPFLSVARFELLRQLRRRRLFVLLIITAVVVVLFIVVLQVFGSSSSDAYAYASTLVTWVTILAALAATFFGADALVGEFENRTGYLLFPQPVSRTSIFFGKLLAAFALTTVTLAAYYGVVAAATGVVKGSVPIEVGYSFLLAILYSTAALGVAFLLSAALRGITMASVLTFMMLFFVLAIASTILGVAAIRPDGNLAFAGGTISNILAGPYPDAYPPDPEGPVGGPGGGFQSYSPAVPTSILVMAIWAAVGFGLAWALFQRREMKA